MKISKIFKITASLKVTVLCLFLLSIQTLWGTLYQIDHGLYAAQHKLFYPWFIMLYDVVPFPGTRLVLWVLLINLISSLINRFKCQPRFIGLWIVHGGLIMLVVSGGVTYHFAKESNITLPEGSGTNVSADYHDWELAIWESAVHGDTVIQQIEAIDFTELPKEGESLRLKKYPLHLKIQAIHANSRAFSQPNVLPWQAPLNGSGITGLEPQKSNSDPALNRPGLIIELLEKNAQAGMRGSRVLLYGGDTKETELPYAGKLYYFSLRHKRHILPFLIKLDEFIKKEHPGTQIASSYESYVYLNHHGLSRRVRIYMNNPLRVEDYTLFQASFSQEAQGETSTLAVVQNPGRVLPYISSILVGVGLIWYFISMLIQYASRTRKKGVKEV